MIGAKPAEHKIGVRLLSVLLAGLLWLGVTLERPGELRLEASVYLEHLPAGLLPEMVPGSLELTVAGPRILLLGLYLSQVSCRLDLTGALAGPASYQAKDLNFRLDPELKVVRVFPAALRITLAKAAPG